MPWHFVGSKPLPSVLDASTGEPTPPAAPPKPKAPAWMAWAIALLSVFVVALGAAEINNTERINAMLGVGGASRAALYEQSLFEQPAHLGQLIERVKQSVVQVYCGDISGTGWAIDMEPPTDPEDLKLYKRFPYSVLTNEHVISDCEEDPGAVTIAVDGVETAAYLYSWDARRDLALLMVQPALPGLDVGARPLPGAWVMTVGNPFELEQAVSIGNVMNIDGIDLVNSAPINHGNSGGPLVNSRGRVVGITTWVRIATPEDPLDVAQDWNVATTIPALCKELIECEGDPLWTWKS